MANVYVYGIGCDVVVFSVLMRINGVMFEKSCVLRVMINMVTTIKGVNLNTEVVFMVTIIPRMLIKCVMC